MDKTYSVPKAVADVRNSVTGVFAALTGQKTGKYAGACQISPDELLKEV